jgi:hypothetical protein
MQSMYVCLACIQMMLGVDASDVARMPPPFSPTLVGKYRDIERRAHYRANVSQHVAYQLLHLTSSLAEPCSLLLSHPQCSSRWPTLYTPHHGSCYPIVMVRICHFYLVIHYITATHIMDSQNTRLTTRYEQFTKVGHQTL